MDFHIKTAASNFFGKKINIFSLPVSSALNEATLKLYDLRKFKLIISILS